jgi:hypothetical protein
MKTTFLFLFLFSLVSYQANSQSQADLFIKEAQDFLAQKNYKQAQLSLQDAINDLNNLVAAQIAESMPAEINGLKSTNAETSGGNMMGMMGGMQIIKTYQNPTQRENEAEVQILANSPMLNAINMYMGNPAMMGSEYKSIRIGSRRAVLKSEMEDYYDDNGKSKSIRSSEIQIPLNQTLITINAKGFENEAAELAFAAKLDIDKLKTLLGE